MTRFEYTLFSCSLGPYAEGVGVQVIFRTGQTAESSLLNLTLAAKAGLDAKPYSPQELGQMIPPDSRPWSFAFEIPSQVNNWLRVRRAFDEYAEKSSAVSQRSVTSTTPRPGQCICRLHRGGA